jgi:hypothetical protein
VSQRREFLAGNFFNNQSVTIALTAQTGDRHPAHRKRDLHGISKAQRSIRRNFRLRSICHRRFEISDGRSPVSSEAQTATKQAIRVWKQNLDRKASAELSQ